jgi:hypothetical protein
MTHTTNDDDEPRTYERQAGEAATVYGTDEDAQLSAFMDPQQDAQWRPPTATELELVERSLDGPVEGLYVAVIDNYQSGMPGYVGPLAIVVGDSCMVDAITLKEP